jgi:hypothetical protein
MEAAMQDQIVPQPEFQPWPKIARLNRGMVVTEKLDGTNACVVITEPDSGGPPYGIFAQSRKRLITVDDDNYGFARWVFEHQEELIELGPGYHYGEWWGRGIQRGYDLEEKRFSLFNVGRWHAAGDDEPDEGTDRAPECCSVVPVLDRYAFDTARIADVVEELRKDGSVAAPGYMNPEGVVVFHTHGRTTYKVTLDNDEKPKGQVNA